MSQKYSQSSQMKTKTKCAMGEKKRSQVLRFIYNLKYSEFQVKLGVKS